MTSFGRVPLVLGVAVLLTAGCAEPPRGDGAAATTDCPSIPTVGSTFRTFADPGALARESTAVVLVTGGGKQTAIPFPAGDGTSSQAPIEVQTMTVTRVLSGTLDEGPLQVVTPGQDSRTGTSALSSEASYLLFLEPGVYAPHRPVGAYVAVGGPAGVWCSEDDGRTFRSSSADDAALRQVAIEPADVPPAQRTEADVLSAGS